MGRALRPCSVLIKNIYVCWPRHLFLEFILHDLEVFCFCFILNIPYTTGIVGIHRLTFFLIKPTLSVAICNRVSALPSSFVLDITQAGKA